VDAAVIFGNDEARVQAAGGVYREPAERRRRLRIFLAAEVVVVLDHPAAGDRAPHEIDGLSGREARRGCVCRSAGDRWLVVSEIERGDRRARRGRGGGAVAERRSRARR